MCRRTEYGFPRPVQARWVMGSCPVWVLNRVYNFTILASWIGCLKEEKASKRVTHCKREEYQFQDWSTLSNSGVWPVRVKVGDEWYQHLFLAKKSGSMIVVQKKCFIAYAKLNYQGHSWPIMWGERNERFWTFGPSLVQDMLKRGDLHRQITPPSAPSPQVPWTQRELMVKIREKSQTIIKWCKKYVTIYNMFCYFRNGQVDSANTQAKTLFVILSWFRRRRIDMLRSQVFKHYFFFSKQTRKESQLTNENNQISCSNIFS